jgi:hypothetical protein
MVDAKDLLEETDTSLGRSSFTTGKGLVEGDDVDHLLSVGVSTKVLIKKKSVSKKKYIYIYIYQIVKRRKLWKHRSP